MTLLFIKLLYYIVRTPANLILLNPIFRICTFWPSFYWSLFRPRPDRPNRRSIWTIICNPVPDFGPKTKNIRNRMVCVRDRYYCHSYYQVQGAYAHLNQKIEKDLDEATHEATKMVYYDDPLRLAEPYEFFLKRLPEPPDGILKSILSIGLILLVYILPVIKGLISLWYRLITVHLFIIDDRNIFVQFGRKRRRMRPPTPELHIKMFTTKGINIYTTNGAKPDENAFSWDTDGIPFVIDNSATGIISNVRKLFVGKLTPTRVTLETADGLTTKN